MTLIQPSPLGAGIARFVTDCCKTFEINIYTSFVAFPLGGRWTKRSLGRMRGATCFLFKIFQTNRLLPLPCFPLWAGFACFITDCRLSFIFLVFAFHLSPCFPLRGKCLHKQTIEVNFNFLTLIQPSPWGAGIARFLTDCCKSHKFKISAFVIGFPSGGSCQRS